MGSEVRRGSASNRAWIRPGLRLGLALLGVLVSASAARAQEGPGLEWERGPGTAPIGGTLAEVDLGVEHAFLDAEGSKLLMELMQNPVSGGEMATIAPIADEEDWFLIFEWDAVGYVADDEKNSLDPDAMLESIREGTAAANEERRKRGWSTLDIVGWHEPPHYDERTKNLSWAIIGESSGGERSINRIIKILGRRGVMTATLVASPEELPTAVPAVDALLEGYRFQAGSTYAEYLPGTDKLAGYGLTALVVGGGGAALVKSGLLAKVWKPLVAALVALGAGIKRLFFTSSQHDPERPIT